jgi:hypothetical protein
MTTMTTLLKIEANRDNALASTGPKSAEGKTVVSGNAIRHGLLSWKPIIPSLDKPEDWEAHLEAAMESLAPVGYVETVLAERVALLMWRLGRVTRYEREVIAIRQENAEAEVLPLDRRDYAPESAADSLSTLRAARRRHDRFNTFLALPDNAALEGIDAGAIVESVAKAVGLNDPPGPPGYPDGTEWENYNGWTADKVRATFPCIAKQARCEVDALLRFTAGHLADKVAESKANNQKRQSKLDQYRRLHLLPSRETMDQINRYETTLERSLYKALHELERRQAARNGQVVPLPVAVDVNLTGPIQE